MSGQVRRHHVPACGSELQGEVSIIEPRAGHAVNGNQELARPGPLLRMPMPDQDPRDLVAERNVKNPLLMY